MSKINTSRLIQVIAIGFILVVCPAASWYYLQKGLDYQKNSRKELVSKDAIQVQQFIPEFVNKDTTLLYNKLRLVALNEDKSNLPALEKLTNKLVDQFEESKGVMLLTLNKASSAILSSSSQPNEMHINKLLTDDEYYNISKKVIGIPSYKEMDGKLILDGLQKGSVMTTSPEKVYAYLIDENDMLRNVYDLLDEARVKRMIEHIAILIPRQDREEVEIRRKKEL